MATAEKKKTIVEQLRALIRLQHIDNRIDRIKKLRGDLPEEIEDLEDEQAGLQTRLDNYEEELKEAKVAKRQGDVDIKEAEGLIKKYEEQQLQVRNNREYDALTKEIETQKERIAEARESIERAEKTIAANESAVADTEGQLDDLNSILEEKHEKLSEVVADTEAEESALEEVRDEAKEEVDDRYITAYSKLRDRLRDGRAVVPLRRGAAAGFAVPPQRQVEIRKRKRVIVCEHTGRIIVDKELYEETAGATNENLDLDTDQ